MLVRKTVSAKLTAVLQANSGWQTLKSVVAVLRGERPDAAQVTSVTTADRNRIVQVLTSDVSRYGTNLEPIQGRAAFQFQPRVVSLGKLA